MKNGKQKNEWEEAVESLLFDTKFLYYMASKLFVTECENRVCSIFAAPDPDPPFCSSFWNADHLMIAN